MRPGCETGVTVRQAAEAWLAEGRTEREWKRTTAYDYAKVAGRICAVLGERPLEAVTEDELRAFLATVQPELNGKPLDRAASTRQRFKYLSAVRAMFTLAEERGWIAVSPADRLRAPRKRRKSKNHPLRREEYLTPEEVQAVVRAAEPDDGRFFLTLAFAGLRLGEALALEWPDVDFARASLHVERNWTLGGTDTPKGGAGRTVPMANELAQALAAHGIATRGGRATEGLVFVGKRGGHLDANRVRLRYYAAQEAAGIAPRRTLHQLRHTFATVLASHGVPLRTIRAGAATRTTRRRSATRTSCRGTRTPRSSRPPSRQRPRRSPSRPPTRSGGGEQRDRRRRPVAVPEGGEGAEQGQRTLDLPADHRPRPRRRRRPGHQEPDQVLPCGRSASRVPLLSVRLSVPRRNG